MNTKDNSSFALALFQKRQLKIVSRLKKRLKKSCESIENCVRELKKAEEWEEMQHKGTLLQANLYRLHLGMREIVVEDWKKEGIERTLKLDPKEDPHKQAEYCFKKSKKLRAAVPHLRALLDKRKIFRDNIQEELNCVESLTSIDELEIYEKRHFPNPIVEKVASEIKKALPFWEFISEAGLKIWVGKSAKDNDRLTFQYGKGSDWWLHVRDWPGSHVILRVLKNKEPDSESLLDAMQLALYYSKARGETIVDISVTQCKYVARCAKEHPGKVQISRSKAITIKRDLMRLSRLKVRDGNPLK